MNDEIAEICLEIMRLSSDIDIKISYHAFSRSDFVQQNQDIVSYYNYVVHMGDTEESTFISYESSTMSYNTLVSKLYELKDRIKRELEMNKLLQINPNI